MAQEEYQEDPYFTEINTKIRDLEEKQRILKDRTMLIGENLIELKEEVHEDMISIKKEIENLKQGMETASGEFSKFARNEDLEILSKQARMFQPLFQENKQEE